MAQYKVSEAVVIIPTYNEKSNISKIIEEIFSIKPDIHILVVDDNSPDRTADEVKRKRGYNSTIFLLERNGKRGLGKAYRDGFKVALEKKYRYIIQMDADFSHNPRMIPLFLKEIVHNDIVIGSRYIKGGGTEGWNFYRELMSRCANFYARSLLGCPINDLTSGFKCIRSEALKKLQFDKILSEGYCFQIELTYRAFLKGLVIKEVPIIFKERKAGKSKINLKIIKEALFRVLELRRLKTRKTDESS